MFYVHEVRNLLRASNFRTPARPAGFENFRLRSIGEVAVYFAMSGLPPEADSKRKGRHVRWVPIVLKESFLGDEQNFLGPLMRLASGDVGDHIVSHKNDHGPSYRRYGALLR